MAFDSQMENKIKLVQGFKMNDNSKTKETFNKNYALREKEYWSEPNNDPSQFRNWKSRVERYFDSAPNEYNIQPLLKYASSPKVVEKTLNLEEVDKEGKYVHEYILNEFENCKETDKLLYNEFMNMISGSLAENKYLNQIPRKSGLEIWRKIHDWNEPKTFN